MVDAGRPITSEGAALAAGGERERPVDLHSSGEPAVVAGAGPGGARGPGVRGAGGGTGAWLGTVLEGVPWVMDDGRWTMDDGRWTMDDGRWTMDDGPVHEGMRRAS